MGAQRAFRGGVGGLLRADSVLPHPHHLHPGTDQHRPAQESPRLCCHHRPASREVHRHRHPARCALISFFFYYTLFLPRGKVRPPDKVQLKAAIIVPLDGFARSEQDPSICRRIGQSLYRCGFFIYPCDILLQHRHMYTCKGLVTAYQTRAEGVCICQKAVMSLLAHM